MKSAYKTTFTLLIIASTLVVSFGSKDKLLRKVKARYVDVGKQHLRQLFCTSSSSATCNCDGKGTPIPPVSRIQSNNEERKFSQEVVQLVAEIISGFIKSELDKIFSERLIGSNGERENEEGNEGEESEGEGNEGEESEGERNEGEENEGEENEGEENEEGKKGEVNEEGFRKYYHS